MKILNVVPVNSDIFTPEINAYVTKYLGPDTIMDTVRIQSGKPSIEGEYDELVNAPYVVELVKQGEKDGYDAAFINCFGDPGVAAARECVDIPVFGGFEPAILIAMGLADKIGVVTVLPNVVPVLRRHGASHHFNDRVVSIRDVGIPVLALEDHEKLCNALIEESIKAIKEDGVEAIVLGCTGMVDVAETVQEGLLKNGYQVPVVEAARSAVMLLELYAKMGLRHSRLTYLKPTEK